MTAEASDLNHFLKVMLDPWLQAPPRLLDDRNFKKMVRKQWVYIMVNRS
jgi:hypothetical protein